MSVSTPDGVVRISGDASPINIAKNLVVGAAGAIAASATKSVIEGTDFGDNLVNALPDVLIDTLGQVVEKKISDITLHLRADIAARQHKLKEAKAGSAQPKPAQGSSEQLVVTGESTNPNSATTVGSPVSLPQSAPKPTEEKVAEPAIEVTGKREKDTGAVAAFMATMPEEKFSVEDREAGRNIAYSIFGDKEKVSTNSREWKMATRWRDEFLVDGAPSSDTMDSFVEFSQDRGYFWTRDRETGQLQQSRIHYGDSYKTKDNCGNEVSLPKEQFFYIYRNGLRV